MLAAQISVPSMSREVSLLPFWKRWRMKGVALFAWPGHGTNGWKAQSQRGLQRAPPQLVILGSLEAGVSHWSECPGWCTQYESGGPLASPRLGPSLCWCLTELCGQVQGSQGSAAPVRGSLLKTSIVSCHHHCQPDGSGFSQAGVLQSQARWKVCVGRLTSFGVKPHSPRSGSTKAPIDQQLQRWNFSKSASSGLLPLLFPIWFTP